MVNEGTDKVIYDGMQLIKIQKQSYIGSCWQISTWTCCHQYLLNIPVFSNYHTLVFKGATLYVYSLRLTRKEGYQNRIPVCINTWGDLGWVWTSVFRSLGHWSLHCMLNLCPSRFSHGRESIQGGDLWLVPFWGKGWCFTIQKGNDIPLP